MIYLVVDKRGTEIAFSNEPKRDEFGEWNLVSGSYIELPYGSIEKLTGKHISWLDKPIIVKDDEYIKKKMHK